MEPKDKQDERYWIEAFRKGEDPALAHFFDLHYKSLCYFASRLIQDDIEAEDIVADCFIKLWKGDRQVSSGQNIKAFLYISCRNASLNYLRHLKVKSAAQEVYIRQLEQGEESILNRIIQSEVLDMLVQEIELLPEKCREVFKLIYFDHKKTDEIALELGLSAKTVRNHKARAIELLKASVLKKGVSDALYLALLLFLDQR